MVVIIAIIVIIVAIITSMMVTIIAMIKIITIVIILWVLVCYEVLFIYFTYLFNNNIYIFSTLLIAWYDLLTFRISIAIKDMLFLLNISLDTYIKFARIVFNLSF